MHGDIYGESIAVAELKEALSKYVQRAHSHLSQLGQASNAKVEVYNPYLEDAWSFASQQESIWAGRLKQAQLLLEVFEIYSHRILQMSVLMPSGERDKFISSSQREMKEWLELNKRVEGLPPELLELINRMNALYNLDRAYWNNYVPPYPLPWHDARPTLEKIEEDSITLKSEIERKLTYLQKYNNMSVGARKRFDAAIHLEEKQSRYAAYADFKGLNIDRDLL